MSTDKLPFDYETQPSCLGDVTCCTDLEWSLYKQVVELKEQVRKLEFMIKNDMKNDISMPHKL